jgi:acyl dehydratase
MDIDQQTLKKYRQLFDLESSGLPILFPHVLLGTHHLYLLGHPDFPLSLLGAVHTQNRIVQHTPMAANIAFQIELSLGQLRQGQGQLEFDLHTRAYQNNQLVWEELSVFKQRAKKISGNDPSPLSIESLKDYDEVARWKIDNQLGKSYAKICRDFNPIHVSSLLARIFGMPKAVAHGMAVLAQACRYGESRVRPYPRNLDVIFKGPVPLGSLVKLVRSRQEPARLDLYVEGNQRPVICIHDH